MNDFGYRLKTSIKSAGYTQAQITSELNLSKNALSNYLNGRIPECMILYKLSKLLNTSMEWLLIGSESTLDHAVPINIKVSSNQKELILNILKLNDRKLAIVEGFVLAQMLDLEKGSGVSEMSATLNKFNNDLSSTSGNGSSLEPKFG